MIGEEYTCAARGSTYLKGYTDEEQQAEAKANGFGDLAPEDLVVVCDDCYHEAMRLTGQ